MTAKIARGRRRAKNPRGSALLVGDGRCVPALGPLGPERLAQLGRDRPRPVVAENAPIETGDRHDAARRRRGENLVGLFQFGSWQSSLTESRVIPSSAPRSEVATAPPVTLNTLKPGPSVTLPSRSSRTQLSAPWS